MKRENAIKEKSYKFAIRIVNLYKHLVAGKREFVLSKQVLRSGTAIGAIIAEGIEAESRPDFIHKMSLANKETSETLYWLNLLKDTGYLKEPEYNSILEDCNEIKSILTSIIKTAKKNESI